MPVILLYGMYIVLNGHLSPGGGFSGGAVMGAGLILYLNAFGFQQRISHVHTVGHRNYVSVLAHQTSNLKSGGPGIEDHPMTWLNQLNGSFRNAAFHRGVQCAFIFH